MINIYLLPPLRLPPELELPELDLELELEEPELDRDPELELELDGELYDGDDDLD